MGKGKKVIGGKQPLLEDGEGDESQDEEVVVVKPAKAAKGKVKGGAKVPAVEVSGPEEDSEDEVPVKKAQNKMKTKKGSRFASAAEESDDASEEEPAPPKPAKKNQKGAKVEKVAGKKVKKEAASDDDEDSGAVRAPVSAFALLAVDSGDDNEVASEEEVVEKKSKNKKNNKKKADSVEKVEKIEEVGGKKGKKKGKKNNEDDEDLDKLLAELELEYATGKKAEKVPEEPKQDIEGSKKKKGRKGKGADEVAVEPVEEPLQIEAAEEAEEATVEVEDEPSKKSKKKKKNTAKEASLEPADEAEANIPEAEPAPVEADGVQDKDEDDTDKKKKKKKKKKGDKTEDAALLVEEAMEEEKDDKKKGKKGKVDEKDLKKGKKGPNKAFLAALQETQRKIKEEEERLRREAEEAERKAAEEERVRQEQLRIEQEKRELRKQREREKKERLKQEGKLLTDKQRAQMARTLKSLEVLRAQGVDVPVVGEKRQTRPGTRIRPSKQQREQQQQQQQQTQQEDAQQPDAGVEDQSADQAKDVAVAEPVVEEVKDSWDAESSSDGEEAEHATTTKEQPATVTAAAAAVPAVTGPAAEDSESPSEGSESSDDDDESGSDEETDSSGDSDDKKEVLNPKMKAQERIQKRREEAEKKRSLDNLRAPVVCVLGHVDTGKTKILDKLRRTHVQDGEAGGITQQIGATNVPIDAIREASKMVESFRQLQLKIPGLLIIDTPGHESFSNLRSRGSSLCDIAILVVDIMHGLEPQTIESINLLKAKKTPFVVALNKIDRLYDWKTNPKQDVRSLIKTQQKNTQQEFQTRSDEVKVQFAEQALNAALFYENPDPRSYISMVPTSAATGDGMGNLMALIVELAQTSLAKRLMFSDELHATVLEVKAISGYGTTIDVILVNGTLHEGDTIVLAGTEGPIVTQIRSLLMPQPMKELRVKNNYTEPKEVKAAQGVKITAKELEKAIAGLNLLVARHPDEVEVCQDEVRHELKSALSTVKLQERGVYVQASTLGSLEALLEFLKTSSIPYSNIRIGPVVKKDVMKASIMLEHDAQYAVILAFDVKIERDAQEMADSIGVKIFQADIIYHLFDRFMAYRDELKQKKRDEFKNIAVFPCKLRILPQFVFNTRDPIVVGVIVESGVVKEGTPLCVPVKEFVEIGIVTTIEVNHKAIECARKGQEVCIKISPLPGSAPKLLGRHFEIKDLLVSKISRESIDACKEYFRDDLQKADWQLMIELKKLFQIL